MADLVSGCDPLAGWAGPLSIWLEGQGYAPGRARRAVHAFTRFSAWMADRGLEAADLDGELIEEYVRAEQRRSGSRTPAAAQYLGLAKRFLAAQGVVVPRPAPSRDRQGLPRLLVGPLVEVIAELVAWLKSEGYAHGSAISIACTAARLSAWMDHEGLDVEDLTDEMLDRFVAAQLHRPVGHPSAGRRIAAVRRFLVGAGLLMPAQVAPPADTPVEIELAAWAQFLRSERSIGLSSVAEYRGWVRRFLEQMAGLDGQVRWAEIDARAMNRYVAERGQGYALASKLHLVTAMKSLMGWAFTTGRVEHGMTAAILAARVRRSADLPRALGPEQVEAIKSAADMTSAVGLRDYAIVVMIVRLGLRAGEVASLRLQDLDWHAGQLTVRGKGGRVLSLPLPTDVGEALVAYLRQARPGGAVDRHVFLRTRTPGGGLSGKGVSGVVARLAQRAGLGTVHTHRLRHTAATTVVSRGGSLIEARELLGHARTDTTMIYARTDLDSLRALVVRWARIPGA